MLPKEKALLLIRIPQEIDRRVLAFEQLLVNLHKILQEHTASFEMTSYNQHIYFFVCVERSIKDLMEGQLYAQYPFAEIEEVGDYVQPEMANQGFAGAELKLIRSDVIPIKTFKEFEGDSLAGIFSLMAQAENDEQVWVQVFLKPLSDTWNLHMKRSWKTKLNNFKLFFTLKNYLKLKSAKTIRQIEKAASKKKAEHHMFETGIRLAYRADSQQRAEQKLNLLVKTFMQFNSLDLNGFKEVRSARPQQVLKEYQERTPPPSILLNSIELASIYHFPHPDDVPHVVHVLAKKAQPPRDLPHDACFGVTNFHNQNIRFGIKTTDRRRHVYVVGKSGTGKSKLLELLITEDIQAGKGVAVLDPHGDLVDGIMRRIPPERMKDVVVFNPGDYDFPIAFNPIEHVPPELRVRVTVGFVDVFKKLFAETWNNRLENVLRYATLAVLELPHTTVLSIIRLLADSSYRASIVPQIQDSVVKNFWVNEFPIWKEKFETEAILPIISKLGQFVSTPLIRNIVGQPVNKIDIEKIMNEGKILLMRISKGSLGEENAALIGSMVITKMHQAAMARTAIPEEERKDFYLYCDEFQYFATDTFAEILSEARKYRLNLTMAHQYTGQLPHRMRTTIFGNVGTIISFRVGAEDAGILENEYTPVFKARDIINLGVREFYIKMSVDGELRNAFSGRTLNVTAAHHNLQEEIIRSSREQYSTPRSEVEEILRREAQQPVPVEGMTVS